MKWQPTQPGQTLPYDYMEKSISIPARRDKFPTGICLQKPLDFPWFKNVNKMMKFSKDICLLSSHAPLKYNRNNYDLLKCARINFLKVMC